MDDRRDEDDAIERYIATERALTVAEGVRALDAWSATIERQLDTIADTGEDETDTAFFQRGFAAAQVVASLGRLATKMTDVYGDEWPEELLGSTLTELSDPAGHDAFSYYEKLGGAIEAFRAAHVGLYERLADVAGLSDDPLSQLTLADSDFDQLLGG